MTDLSACVIHYFVYVCYVHQIHLLAKQNNVNLLNLYSCGCLPLLLIQLCHFWCFSILDASFFRLVVSTSFLERSCHAFMSCQLG